MCARLSARFCALSLKGRGEFFSNRPVHAQTLTGEVEYVPPKDRVYRRFPIFFVEMGYLYSCEKAPKNR